jgi:hypothetical protein
MSSFTAAQIDFFIFSVSHYVTETGEHSINHKNSFAYTMFMSNTLDKRKKEIIHTWIAGQSSCTLIIPKPWHRNMV